MKQSLRLMIITILALLLFACGSKYDRVESTLSDYADAMEDYVARMEKAESADDVVNAMKGYTQKIKTLIPRLQEMHKQFPELASGKKFPGELEKVSRRMKTMGDKVQAAMMKTMQYMMDPKVQKAMTEQAQAMAQTGQ